QDEEGARGHTEGGRSQGPTGALLAQPETSEILCSRIEPLHNLGPSGPMACTVQ
ncbi:hypothetical protein E2320_000906, partial [Naja naja]